MEQVSKKKEIYFETLAGLLPAGVFVSTAAGRIIYANEYLSKLTGLNYEEGMATNWMKTLHPDDKVRVMKEWSASRKEDRLFKLEYRFVHRNRLVVWVLGQIVYVKDVKGKIVNHVGVVTDITQQRAAEERKHLQKLQLARVSNLNAMGELASSLAHQLNQPLTIVSSYAQECRQQLLSAGDMTLTKIIDGLKKINFHADRAGQIIQRMRNFFSGQALQKSAEDINKVIFGVIKFLNEDLCCSGKVSLNLSKELPLISFDRVQIEQVLLNILQNAFEAIKERRDGCGQIIIRTYLKEKNLIVSVCNTGAVIPKTVLKNIFDPFFTTKKSGMGMGLTICRSIIESHGGEMAVFSEEGGTQFYFTLPIVNSASRAGLNVDWQQIIS